MDRKGMKVKIGKLMPKDWLAHAGVKGTGVPDNATIDVSNDANLAILAMALNAKPFSVTLEPVVTMMNFPMGSNSYFPTVKFILRKGSKIGAEIVTARDKVLELEHWKGKDKDGVWKDMRPSAIKADEVVSGALKPLNDKLFPPSDLTDKPVPPTDYCTLLAREFGWDSEHLMKAAEYCEKYGMTFRGLYEGEVQKRKMNKK